MMKKKHREQEATEEKNHSEQTDNKAHNNNTNNSSDSESENNGSNNKSGESINADKSNKDISSVEEKLAEMQDKYIRLSAEFDNYRKRTLREKMDMSKYAGENLLLKLLPVMDDFDRAVKHMENATDCSAMKSGIDLIYVKLGDFLKQNGISEIESLNSNFNVDVHEAVAKVEVPEADKKGKVIDVVQKGYYLQDKVLRFSKVVVGE
jgi:molecular chaperone GrpE